LRRRRLRRFDPQLSATYNATAMSEYPRDRLLFLPLGGSGEIGMNLNLFAFGGKWLMVDLGVTFGGEENAGVEVIMPDPAFIVERRKDLIGLVLTHAHEDHLGAVAYLWRKLECPVYATGFAASVLRRKLDDADLTGKVPVHVYRPGDRLKLPPFEVEPIYITHSIPEPMALAIRTKVGTILHTGDWKFDDAPVLGPLTDEAGLRRVGEEGVLALVGDSTNALREGESGSESAVRENLTTLIGRFDQRVVVGCFSSNIGRLDSIARAAAANDRQCALVGRSLWRMYDCAKENGYLREIPPFISEEDAGYLPRDKIVLICTGSQGEPRSALARIAAEDHPHIDLQAGDTVVFSSRVIPGNERAILNLQNALVRRGIQIVSDDDLPPGQRGPIHVSGHPARDELAQMYQYVRPHIAIPVHGEDRHMRAHAELARACQVPHAIVPHNGTLIEITREGARMIDEVYSGRIGLDGDRLVPMDGDMLRARGRMRWNGALVATIILDRKGRLVAEPQLSAPGLFDADADAAVLDHLIETASGAARKGKGRDDDEIRDAVSRALRKAIKERTGKRPQTSVHLVRV
jgi:ribonuclease J